MKKKLNLKLKANTDESLYDDLEKVRLKHSSNKDLSMEEIEADLKDRFKRAVEAYKHYSSVQSKDDLLEENLSENTINRVSRDFAIGTDKIRELLREEATKMDDANTTPEKAIADKIENSNSEITPNQAEKSAEAVKEIAQKTDSELDVIYVEGDIEKALNASLSVGMRSHNKWLKRKEIDKNGYSNICIVGDVGVGKTERVKAWCNAHKIRMVSFKADSLTIDDIKAIPIGEDPDNPGRAKTVSFGTFDIFDKEDLCVLYLDEYNRASTSKRNAWFKFMDEHAIYDPMNKETGMKFFPNLLFTIVTINPYVYEDGVIDDEEGVSPLSKAEKNRFAAYMHLSSQGADFNKYEADYFKKYYKRATQLDPEDAEENAGRLSIALKLLENPNFFFNNTAKINSLHSKDSQFLTPRSLTLLLTRCDGTVENFLALAPYAVGDENTRMLKTLLKNYTNIADKPNEVWSFWDNFGLKLPKEESEEAEEAEEAEQGILQKKSNMLDKLNDLRNRHI